MNHLNTFIKAKNLDKQMILDYLQGQDPRKVYPLYHAPLVPTFAGALDIFQLKKRRSRWRPNSAVTATSPLLCSCMTGARNISRAGASQDRDQAVAEWLAFSNAVRQITF